MTSTTDEVLIIGAGVGGLCLAQGLHRRGIRFRVFERDESLAAKSQGYRFRLVHAGLEALERTLPPDLWDLLERTHARDSPPDLLRLDARSGETVLASPAEGATDRERRCYPIDRPWFRELLRLGIEDRIEFGKAFVGFEHDDDEISRPGEEGDGIRVAFADGTTSARASLVVAADGVHSAVRRTRFPHLRPHLDVRRTVMWGRTPLTRDFERRFARPDVLAAHFAYMVDPASPARSCLFAPIRWPGSVAELSGGRLSETSDYMFWALTSETPPATRDVNSTPEARAGYALDITRNWQSNLRSLFEMQDADSLYAVKVVSSAPDIHVWETDSRLTFVGDAIHAMSPSGGSGGLTTIQDVADLCDALVDAGFGTTKMKDPEKTRQCLQTYENEMRVRAKAALERSYRGGKAIWAGQEWYEYDLVQP
jgi:2-polyprenyl-6-methoxyphenol hydroxylase-like FAD-dependent oxidoreductase